MKGVDKAFERFSFFPLPVRELDVLFYLERSAPPKSRGTSLYFFHRIIMLSGARSFLKGREDARAKLCDLPQSLGDTTVGPTLQHPRRAS